MAAQIHTSALVSKKAAIEPHVEVGPFTIIHDHVSIGAGSRIGSHCEIGIATPQSDTPELVIGAEAMIRSHSVFYAGSTFGSNLTTGHRVTVRENTHAGSHFQIGTLTDIQGHCQIGDHVRFHSNVHVGQKSKIGNFVWIFPYVVLTNDPHPPSEHLVGCELEDFAVVSTMSTVLPGVRVGRGAFIGAMCLVREDVPEDTICLGVPGKNVGPTSKIRHHETQAPAYPWRRHFHRGYPPEVVEEWAMEFEGHRD